MPKGGKNVGVKSSNPREAVSPQTLLQEKCQPKWPPMQQRQDNRRFDDEDTVGGGSHEVDEGMDEEDESVILEGIRTPSHDEDVDVGSVGVLRKMAIRATVGNQSGGEKTAMESSQSCAICLPCCTRLG